MNEWNELSIKEGLNVDPKQLKLLGRKIINFSSKRIPRKNMISLTKLIIQSKRIKGKLQVVKDVEPVLFSYLEKMCIKESIHIGVLLAVTIKGCEECMCVNCGGGVPFVTNNFEFQEFCGRTCANQHNTEARESTVLKKYGSKNVSQVEEFKKNRKETHLRLYGVENAFQSEKFKAKIKVTMTKRYGESHPMHVAAFVEKQKQTTFTNFGVENPLQSSVIREKCAKTMVSRYGESHPSRIRKSIEQSKRTSIDRWGTPFAAQSDKYKKDKIKGIQEKYGKQYTNTTQVPEIFGRQQFTLVLRIYWTIRSTR